MKQLYNQHINAIRNSIKRLFKQPVSSISILIMLGIALALPLTLYLSVQSFELILNKLTIDPSITVFMENNTPEEEISSISSTLQDHQNIQSVKYIDKEDALTETSNILEQKELINMFDQNPLPDAFSVIPKDVEPSQISQLTSELKQLPYVNQVSVDSQWVQTLYQIKSFINKILIFLSVTLSFAFILISHNTIRLQILSCRDEIDISHLLGASSSFIRRPFLYQAFWQAILTIILGVCITSITMLTAFRQAKLILTPYGIQIQQRIFTVPELLWITLIVVALALIGATWASWQSLKEFEQQIG
ncbi:MAG: FtsX-like permease family protein [Neisseriaceae bacterium]|nr:MAG: FtsX-like permease family protein [Neisseriaceae bacterium]